MSGLNDTIKGLVYEWVVIETKTGKKNQTHQ